MVRVNSRVAGKKNYTPLIAGIMAICAIVDQAAKALVLANLEPGVIYQVIGTWFKFRLVFNPGAAFGMGESSTWLFSTLQLLFVVGTLIAARYIRAPWTAVGLALIGGGALGNLIDRLVRAPGFWFGHVVDYISVGSFAIFNIADACINVGVVVFIIGIMTQEDKEATA